ncbi:hypothetical protein LNV09_14425 [Paucibacter sp. B2R-40]|uniref:hypothetical protein n=1 Tax=Paucibacter sp. B2R-40 TaxID=2893554 RepID=UPI0021E4278F|nr:hypothetical protein [Paucibacter sp. B2R-40]MCV2355346.1 hypothetical protein [Paucibacter sp. B2R-40]
MTTEEKPAPRAVRCAACGWVHFALSPVEIQEFVTAENEASYRNCSRCGTPDNFVPASPTDAPPLLANVPGCICEPTSPPAQEEQVAARPRTAKMDSVAKHVSSNGWYAFDAACSAVGNAFKTGPVDLEALALATGVYVEVLRTFAGISDPENRHLFTAAYFLSRKVSGDFLPEHAFSLNFKLAPQDADHGKIMERLSAVGCTDALVCLGVEGHVGLEILRKAGSREEAVLSAIEDAKKALPTAKLVEDLFTAEHVGNALKLAAIKAANSGDVTDADPENL